jgi:S1-C subfamily serine protease
MADAVDRVAASLVTVYGRDRQAATGIVIGDGLVLASDHTLERDDNLQIETPDGHKLAAQLGGRDGATDLAILKIADLNLPSPQQQRPPGSVSSPSPSAGRLRAARWPVSEP